MPSTFTNLKYHIVFVTYQRLPMMKPEHQPRIYAYVGGVIRRLGGVALAVNGMEDHLHLLVSLNPSHQLSALVAQVKKSSSSWVREELQGMQKFAWGRGFGAFTVSQSSICNVANYISTQKDHHKKRSCQEELILLLKQHNILFDAKYI